VSVSQPGIENLLRLRVLGMMPFNDKMRKEVRTITSLLKKRICRKRAKLVAFDMWLFACGMSGFPNSFMKLSSI
jgi:hypothetical protein